MYLNAPYLVDDGSGCVYYELGVLDKVDTLYTNFCRDIEGGPLSIPGIPCERYFCDTLVDSFCRNFHKYSLPKVRIWAIKSVGKCSVCEAISKLIKEGRQLEAKVRGILVMHLEMPHLD